MQKQTTDGVDLYYLAFGDDDDEEAGEHLAEIHHRIRFDDFSPTQDDFDLLWEYEGHDPGATLETVFGRWNAGSQKESAAFARRECEDCDAVFTGERDYDDWGERPTGEPPQPRVDLAERERAVDRHERETREEPHKHTSGHTVGHGHRSLSVGDIVVDDGTAYLICQFEMKELPHIEVGD